uniref:Uncharacterized protein n=1 Tax=Knipowitschia caucasica TaxID=637954 RepID=A0AAV2LIH3_KNICA
MLTGASDMCRYLELVAPPPGALSRLPQAQLSGRSWSSPWSDSFQTFAVVSLIKGPHRDSLRVALQPYDPGITQVKQDDRCHTKDKFGTAFAQATIETRSVAVKAEPR